MNKQTTMQTYLHNLCYWPCRSSRELSCGDSSNLHYFTKTVYHHTITAYPDTWIISKSPELVIFFISGSWCSVWSLTTVVSMTMLKWEMERAWTHVWLDVFVEMSDHLQSKALAIPCTFFSSQMVTRTLMGFLPSFRRAQVRRYYQFALYEYSSFFRSGHGSSHLMQSICCCITTNNVLVCNIYI